MVTTKLNPKTITKFVNTLPNLLTPGLFIDATSGGTYDITMSQGLHNFGLGAVFAPTLAWGYHSTSAPLWEQLGLNYLGPTIVAYEGVPISINWTNDLPTTHLLAVDDTPHGAEESITGGVRVQPHVHGGLTVASSDGNPFSTDAFLGTETYNYRNAQDPATIWYHDHALGITRLNVYAGLAGFYIIRDDQDTGIGDNPQTPVDENPLDLPSNYFGVNYTGGIGSGADPNVAYEFPIVIQDKTFDINGNLYYPAIQGDPLAGPGNPTVPVVPGVDGFGTVNPFPGGATAPTIVTEYAGDVMIVNGVAWPQLDVEPRTYRFRLLNGSDSRFYTLKLPKGLEFQVIGTDNGLLDGPAVAVKELPIAPGERYDVIIDFSKQAGKTLTLSNVQGGTGSRPIFNDPQTTGQIMQFNVLNVAPTIANPINPQWKIDLRPNLSDTIPVWTKNANGTWTSTFGNTTTAPGNHALAIFEGLDDYGRLFPHLGTVNEGSLLWTEDPLTGILNANGEAMAAPAEIVKAGVYTLFQIYNTTPDAHPIHLHGTEFQILERQKIAFTLVPDVNGTDALMSGGAYLTSKFADTNGDGLVNTNDITLLGKAVPVAAYEMGFKDTAIVKPGEMISVVAKYDPALLTQDPFGDGAGKYVWHCHILSHEDHEMMRPLQLVM
jgi:spore coat protein A, manganese oxidase